MVIYLAYIKHIPDINNKYKIHNEFIKRFLLSRFQRCSSPDSSCQPVGPPCDPTPDPFDTVDFEVPHDKSMVEAFMAGS